MLNWSSSWFFCVFKHGCVGQKECFLVKKYILLVRKDILLVKKDILLVKKDVLLVKMDVMLVKMDVFHSDLLPSCSARCLDTVLLISSSVIGWMVTVSFLMIAGTVVEELKPI